MELLNEELGKLDTVYIPGSDSDFVSFIQSLGDKANLKGIEGHFRWVVTKGDGTKYIARPENHE